jgi:hypothetical protein
MDRRSFPELQQENPYRRPTWRWDRATDLVTTGQFFTAEQDDTATGIAVAYLRALARCNSELRLDRVQTYYQHVDRLARQAGEVCAATFNGGV